MSLLPYNMNDTLNNKEAVTDNNSQDKLESEPRDGFEIVGKAVKRTQNDFPGTTDPRPTLEDNRELFYFTGRPVESNGSCKT